MPLVRRMLVTASVLAAISCAGPSAPDSFAAGSVSTPANAAQTLSAMLEQTNAERRRAGLPTLHASPQLAQAAQLQSEQMGAATIIGHVIPGAPYPSPSDRLAAVNYRWETYGENVAKGQRSGSDVVAAWMSSAGHRANILNPGYTEFGVGYALDGAGHPYYAQIFARPRP